MTVNHDQPPDAEALVRRLHDEHASSVLAWIRSRSADRHDAEDIVAETLVKAWRNYDQFDPSRGNERAWVFGIARNVANDHFRRQARNLRLVAAMEGGDPVSDDVAQLAEASVVHDALMDLSDNHRQVIVEAYFSGRPVREIGERLGIPGGTVKSRLFYAMKALRASLEERGILQ